MGGNNLPNLPHHRLGSAENVVIPEAQNAIALFLQPLSAARVVLNLLCMLTAIDFDDDAALEADKIDDECADWLLAAKFDAGQLAPSEL